MNPSVSESGTYCIYLAALWLSKNQLLITSTSVNKCKMFFPMDGKLVHHKLPWALSGFSKSYRVSCYPFKLLGEGRHRHSEMSYPRTQDKI